MLQTNSLIHASNICAHKKYSKMMNYRINKSVAFASSELFISITLFPCCAKILPQWFSACGLQLSSQRSPQTIKKHRYYMQFITIAKLPVTKQQQKHFMIGGHDNIRNSIKGLQHQEGSNRKPFSILRPGLNSKTHHEQDRG